MNAGEEEFTPWSVHTEESTHGESTRGGVHTEESTHGGLYTRGEHKREERTRRKAQTEESCPHRGEHIRGVHTQECARGEHTGDSTHGDSTQGESTHGGVHARLAIVWSIIGRLSL